jgi:putative ABC transport system permease protein
VRSLALAMLLHRPARFISSAVGVTIAFVLAATQIGLLVGWCSTISAIIRHSDVDVWIMAKQTAAFDYGTAIPKHRIQQVRSVRGVTWAEGMLTSWLYWKRPDGSQKNIMLIGLDESLVGGPWKMADGYVTALYEPDAVIVDELFCKPLGVIGIGDEVEIMDAKARICGVSSEVRTFTAAPFVFTRMKSVGKFDRRFRGDETSFVLVRCQPGLDGRQMCRRIETFVPGIEALTSEDFAGRSVRYWMLETGVGFTVVLTAILGMVVSVIIISQTLFTVTQEHLPAYAMLAALGFSRSQLVACVLTQAAMLAGSGIVLGSALFYVACVASARTPIPLETTPTIFSGIVSLSLLSSLAASYLSVKTVLSVDPVSVFRA